LFPGGLHKDRSLIKNERDNHQVKLKTELGLKQRITPSVLFYPKGVKRSKNIKDW
jgi:hypothetical protein